MESPRWVARVSAILLGWNIALISTFLTLISSIILFRNFGIEFSLPDARFFFLVGLCVLLGLLLGTLSGRASFAWFCRRTQRIAYVLLFILVVFTIVSFPARFTYML